MVLVLPPGKAQPFDLLVRGHVWKQFFAQLLQIIPIGVRAFIDAFVIVAAGVQRDEMPFLDGALQQGQVFLVVVRRHDRKKWRGTPSAFSVSSTLSVVAEGPSSNVR